jgi:putative two-component system response regulator
MSQKTARSPEKHRTRAGILTPLEYKYKILIADDMATIRQLIKAVLPANEYDVIEARDGSEALQLMAEHDFDLVLLDIMMPKLTGFEALKKARAKYPLLPIIMVTTLDKPEDIEKAFDQGATDYVIKPFIKQELFARIEANVRQKRLVDNLDDATTILFTLARLVEERDSGTGEHGDRLVHYAMVFGNKLKLSYDEMRALRNGAILHDIGKLVIPDSILLKPGKLDAGEWEVMKMHAAIGSQLCSPLKTFQATLDIIHYHHERWDGSGYPDGLKGNKIPYLARVFQIIDIYDALVSERPYKKAFSAKEAARLIKEEMAKNWLDPQLAQEFLTVVQKNAKELNAKSSLNGTDKLVFKNLKQSGAIELIKKTRQDSKLKKLKRKEIN